MGLRCPLTDVNAAAWGRELLSKSGRDNRIVPVASEPSPMAFEQLPMTNASLRKGCSSHSSVKKVRYRSRNFVVCVLWDGLLSTRLCFAVQGQSLFAATLVNQKSLSSAPGCDADQCVDGLSAQFASSPAPGAPRDPPSQTQASLVFSG